jgi:uncharacterized damage-inducible protein DinB
MGDVTDVKTMMLGLVDDCTWNSPWHSLAEAVSDLSDADLAFRPTRGLDGPWTRDMARPSPYGARAIYRHLIDSTLEAADALPGGPRARGSFDWECGASELATAADAACREGRNRAERVADDDLWLASAAHDALEKWSNAEVVVQCLVLHTSWHLGQLALIPAWRWMGNGTPPEPGKHATSESLEPSGGWPFHMEPVTTGRALVFDVLSQAQGGCPWHGLERVLDGLTDEEAGWRPYAPAEGHCSSIADLAGHVAACDVMYADMAFGKKRADWAWVGSVISPEGKVGAAEAVVHACRRGYEFLTETARGATDDDLWAVHEMHHGRPLKGWEVLACMVQHRLWHGGQIAMIRSAYSGRP